MNDGSIIIPALDEEGGIVEAIESVRPLGAEVIVVDGGSRDATAERARKAGARVIHAARGRGIQLAVGAAAARGSWFLFLHADSHLTDEARRALAGALADPAFQVGTFRLRLGSSHPLHRFYSWFTRFDSIWTSFGDQGIVIRRPLYEAIGGFPPWPLLEDVALLRRARAVTGVRSIPAEVVTSTRRFDHNGIVRQQFLNMTIIVRYLLGSDPAALARSYSPPGPPLRSVAGTSIDIPSARL